MIRNLTNARPQLKTFFDAKTDAKLSLDDILHSPVSRIPRYALLLKVCGWQLTFCDLRLGVGVGGCALKGGGPALLRWKIIIL